MSQEPTQEPVKPSWRERLRHVVIGRERSPFDRSLYHKISLVAFFAWVGLGADGISSSCYGPEESFLALGQHPHLGLLVALATAVTIFVIASSYSQIIELFPSGGGGYLVASKLLSPGLGLVAGSALLIDYVLTISISIASGADALFSFLPLAWQHYKLPVAVIAVLVLFLLNLRGARESVAPLVPIFLTFIVAHAVLIILALTGRVEQFGTMLADTASDIQATQRSVGLFGLLFVIMHAYSMGAGTFTGIEAVSNGMPVLREPRVQTAKRTMTYMWISLAVVVVGLMVAYLLYGVHLTAGRTLNASLLDSVTATWASPWGPGFVLVTLLSEAAILFVAAQTGFLGGPRVMANMALDRWLPARLSMLSDRMVTHNGVLIMGIAAMVTLVATGGNVGYLVVLYAINVFITFTLSQAGMVRHWWQVRRSAAHWKKKLAINGIGLSLTLLILVWVIIAKFTEGGWVTLLATGLLVMVALLIRRHYNVAARMVQSLDQLAQSVIESTRRLAAENRVSGQGPPQYDPAGKTAVILVSGFNGLGLHSLLNVVRFFGNTFRNFVFVGVGVIDAGNFKGVEEAQALDRHVKTEVEKYIEMMQSQGFFAEGYTAVGTDIVDEVAAIAPQVVEKYRAVFFAGQLVYPQDTIVTRLLHNNIAFAAQRRLYLQGIPFVVLPFRVQTGDMGSRPKPPRGGLGETISSG